MNNKCILILSCMVIWQSNAMGSHLITLDPEIKQRAELSLLRSDGREINLSHLRLAKDQLALLLLSLPEYLRIRVERIHLVSCELYIIPPEIALLRNLRVLNVVDNALFEIPPVIGSLPLLEIINVSFNEISVISETIGSLVHLRKLFLEANELSTIPDCIARIATLEKITLSDNPINMLPPGLLGRQKAGTLAVAI